MANRITLSNGREWKSQKAAEAHFREILYRHPVKTPIDNAEDHDDLCALLERYDSALIETTSKIGCGIDFFEVRMNSGVGWTTPGFWVVRVDNTETDFSFPIAVKGTPKPEAYQFADACRAAIAADLIAAKKAFFRKHGDELGCVPCELTDEPITIVEAHLDHAFPTFGGLVTAYRAALGWHLQIPPGVLTTPQDAQTTTTFLDPALADRFRLYHHAGATMRVIAKRKNLSMAASQRRPKIRRPVEL